MSWAVFFAGWACGVVAVVFFLLSCASVWLREGQTPTRRSGEPWPAPKGVPTVQAHGAAGGGTEKGAARKQWGRASTQFKARDEIPAGSWVVDNGDGTVSRAGSPDTRKSAIDADVGDS